MARKSSFPFFHTIMHNGAYDVGNARSRINFRLR